jgi:hypothetical protein
MAEYINRDTLQEVFENRMQDDNMMCPVIKVLEVLEIIENHPEADVVEVVHGKWIRAGLGITERIVCSHCHSHKGSYLKPPFCNQCGAKMDGDDNA